MHEIFIFCTIRNICISLCYSLQRNINSVDKMISNKMKLKIRSDTFTATLYDNETTAALITMLPLTLNMTELNRNEKYKQLSTDLPTSILLHINRGQ
jgi:hypothetical protein